MSAAAQPTPAPRPAAGPPSARRLAFHAGLAVACGPLPGAVLVAARSLRHGHPRRGALALGAAVATSALGAALALWAPVGWRLALGGTLLVWLVAGIGLAWIERAAHPSDERRRDGRLHRHVLRWAIALPIAWFWIAIGWAIVWSEWGGTLLLKPSAPRQVLLAAVVLLVPLGAALGAYRWLAGRPLRSLAPLAVTAAMVPLLCGAAIAMALVLWILESVFLLPDVTLVPGTVSSTAQNLLELVLFLLPLVLLAEHIASAGGVRAFLGRLGLASLTFAAVACSYTVVSGELGVRVAERRALNAAERGDWAKQARLAEWNMRRAPIADLAPLSRERGAAAALRAGQPDRARRLLESVVTGVAPVHGELDIEHVAGRLLSTRLETTGAVDARVRVIRPESYLAPNQAAVLTAILTARTDLSETRLKLELRALSQSADGLQPVAVRTFADVELWAASLGCLATALPSDGIEAALASGTPVLFEQPHSGRWGLLTWLAPNADAVVWLDFERASRRRQEGLERAEITQLVESDDEATREHALVLAEIARLDSLSLLRERLQLAGGWVVAIGRQTTGTGLASDPLSSAARTLGRAQTALDAGDFDRAAALTTGVPELEPIAEVHALAELGARNARLRRGESLPPASPRLAALLDGRAVAALGPEAAVDLCGLSYASRELTCSAQLALVERLAHLYPGNERMQGELAHLRAEQDDAAGLVTAARDWLRAAAFSTPAVLDVIAIVAPEAGTDDELLALLRELVDRVPILLEAGEDEVFGLARGNSAAWHAGRAALAEDPGTRAAAWREAVRLDPGRAPYRLALAAALEELGQPAEAAEERARARLYAGDRQCAARAPACR